MAVPGDDAYQESVYKSLKPLLFSLAYRMLGSVMDAEDVVQESFMALERTGSDHIANVRAYLCKTVTNRCLNLLQSSAKKRELYQGPWLPEPLIGEPGRTPEADDPLQSYVHKESLATAYMLLLQQLSYVERAVFLLREVLQYDYDEIADIVGKSSVNCRQIYHRAKRSLGSRASEARGEVPPADSAAAAPARLVEQFVHALANADVDRLMHLLSADTALTMDGGGKVTALPRTVVGGKRIAVFMATMPDVLPPDAAFHLAEVNGLPGVVVQSQGQTIGVASFDYADGRIAAIYIVVNPDKLRHVALMQGGHS
ncbi:MAG: RNA polymerase sigma factor SigJ [Paenibacillaceae bacterium]|nr:MAG: RNA polymerase sigma factor SigJ [Paenibacillaceae bacterium]